MAAESLSGQGDGGLDHPVVLKTRLPKSTSSKFPS